MSERDDQDAERYPDEPEAAAPDEDYLPDDEEPRSRRLIGCSWRVVFVLAALLGLVLGGAWLINRIADRGATGKLKKGLPEISLLPSATVRPPESPDQVQLYYIARGRALAAETRRLRRPAAGAERIELIAQELAQPPLTAVLKSPLPEGTRLRGVFLIDGVVWIDLSGEFLRPPDPAPLQERLVIYSLVNTFMLNDKTLKGVRIMIDGRPVDTAWGWLDLSQPLGPDLALIR